MLEKVLCPINFEGYEPELMQALVRLKNAGCRELVLAHISSPGKVLSHVPRLLKDELGQCLATASRNKLEELAEVCRAQGVPARTVIRDGDLPWLEIRELAEQEAAALIVDLWGTARRRSGTSLWGVTIHLI